MLERILSFSLEHRYLVVLIALLAGAAGVYSLLHLPIDAVPDITNNQVQINTEAAALSPNEIESQVTQPIETALAGIPGLESTRSISRNGFSQVTAIFGDHVDIYFARQQVNERLAEARSSMPARAEPVMGAISTGLGEVFMWTVEFSDNRAPSGDATIGWQTDGSYITPEDERLGGEVERATYLRTVQDWIIRPQLKTVKDVAGVDAIGGYVKQFHIQPDVARLMSFGLSFRDLIDALERNNNSIGAGYVERNGEAVLVRAGGRIENLQEISEIVVGTRNGTPIHVHDVATVAIGTELRTGSASSHGEEVVVGTAMMLIGANSRTVAADVAAKMAEINKSLPAGVIAKPVLDRTKLVDATIRTVGINLFEGAILVIAILLLLLGNVRAAIIVAAAIPLSMLITAIGMVQSRISGNLMSLGAIDFGLIVDGSVIIVENCIRRLAHRQQSLGRALFKEERLAEIRSAAKEMLQPSVFGQAIIIVVYLPILTLVGIEGKMFKPMALTVMLALLAALIISVTVIPALIAIFLGGKVRERESFLVGIVKRAYVPSLQLALRARWFVVLSSVVVFAASAWLFTRLGQEFAPTLDEKDIAMHAMRIASTSLTQSTKMQLEVERKLSKVPEVLYVFSKTGTAEMASDPMPPNVSDTFIILKPQAQWRPDAEIDRLVAEKEAATGNAGAHRDEHDHGSAHGPPPKGKKGRLLKLIELTVNELPGNNYEFTQPIQMRFNELISGVRSDLAVKVYGDDTAQMRDSAEQIAAIMQKVAGAADVKVEQTDGLPVMQIQVDRPAIARLGLSVADVQDVVSIAIGGHEAGRIFQGDRRFDLVVRLPSSVRDNVSNLGDLLIPLHADDNLVDASRGYIPLSTVAKLDLSEGPNQISRENGKRRIVIQANVRGRDLGSFVADVRMQIESQLKLPAGQWLDYGGQFENLLTARRRLQWVVPACFVMIFIMLFAALGSVKQALFVFSGVPLALCGGILALWLRGMPFSISAAIGFIALSGVAVLNGMVMISQINQLRKDGTPLAESVQEGSSSRLRPVLMTALVASLGFIPMALATGTGAEVQKPLATVVIGGIVSSTLLTLIVLPVLYQIFHRQEINAE